MSVALYTKDLRKTYPAKPPVEAVRGLDLEVRRRRVLRPARARTAPARRPRSRSSKGCSTPTSGDVEVLGLRWAPRRGARCASGSASRCRRRSFADKLTVARDARAVPHRSTARGRRADEVHRAGRRSREKRDAWVEQPLRRAAAAARGRVRAGRRSGPAVPRRADDRARSAVAPPALGRHPRPARARADDPAHDALHGRGRAAVRPRRDRRPRQGDRARLAGRADRARSAASTSSSSRSRAGGTADARAREPLRALPVRASARARRPSACSSPSPSRTSRSRRCSTSSTRDRRAAGAAHDAPREPRGRLRAPDREAPAR